MQNVQASFTVGITQMSCSSEPTANLSKAVERIRALASDGANVVCLQELFNNQYFCQRMDPELFDLAEPIPGPTTQALGEVARELGVVVVTSIFEKRGPGVYHNTGIVLDADGSLAGVYRKAHIPETPRYHEKYYFAPGESPQCAWQTRYGKIAVLVCWDQWFPEAARMAALQGAVLIVYPTAIGHRDGERMQMGETKSQAWETMQRSHAIANGCYVAGVNRVGYEQGPNGGLEFWGKSFVADPFGRILAQAGGEEESLTAICDPLAVDRQRRYLPLLRDRRVELYGSIMQRYVGS